MAFDKLPSARNDLAMIGTGPPLRVLIADDHTLIREGTRRILEQQSDFEVVGEAASGDVAVELAGTLHPDVVILDVRMPGLNGIEAARRISLEHPASRVLIVSAYDDEPYVVEALRAGASGYLLKTASSSELVNAVRAVGTGATVLQDGIVRRLAESSARRTFRRARSEVSQRELGVVQLIAEGMSNKEVARRLAISPRTVEGHLNNVFVKLGVASRTELVRAALASRLITLEA